ncbi:MAG TPA: hypothetical protein VH877_29035 [Polyangia bacterium]|jgi:hypothetical protein|nr:hypothetical protein [Polyangia bacterium]
MAQLIEREAISQLPQEREKAVKILAKSLFRELKTNGYDNRQILALSSELLGLVTTEIRPSAKTSDPTDG